MCENIAGIDISLRDFYENIDTADVLRTLEGCSRCPRLRALAGSCPKAQHLAPS